MRNAPRHTYSEAELAIQSMRRPTEVTALGVLTVTYSLVYSLDLVAAHDFMNIIGPAALMFILLNACFEIALRHSLAVWAPLFWFRLACAVYYGFGALLPQISGDERLNNIFSLYRFSSADSFKVNLIYTSGIFATILFSYALLGIKSRYFKKEVYLKKRNGRSRIFFGLSFLIVGGILRYGVILPEAMGQGQAEIAGSIIALSKVFYVGIFILFYHALKYQKSLLLGLAPVFMFDLAISCATFSKSEILLLLVFSYLAVLSAGTTRPKIILGAVSVFSIFLVSASLVGFGRQEMSDRYGPDAVIGLEERLDIIQSWSGSSDAGPVSPGQDGLARLSYMNISTFVVNEYDLGRPGRTLENAYAVLIPRALWQNKPVITQLGRDLYHRVRGYYATSLGIGHFAEAYWNFGWAGIAPLMAVLALILSAFTRFSMYVVSQEDWLYFPVVLMGANIGLRVDGHFVPDVLGATWMAVIIGFAVYLFRLGVRRPLPHAQRRPSYERY